MRANNASTRSVVEGSKGFERGTMWNGEVRIYLRGTRRFASKLWAHGYRREERVAMTHELAADPREVVFSSM